MRAYNRIQLSPVLGAEKAASETLLLPASWYPRHNVTVRAGETVTAVDIAARTLQTTAGELGWDELVFATGSLPFLPPLPGITQPHVFAFRTTADVEGIGHRRPGGGHWRRRTRRRGRRGAAASW